MPMMSMRAYAKHRGVTVQAVSKAVAAGRISCRRNERGYAEIDPAVADREWDDNSDPTKFRSSGEENRTSKIEAPPEDKPKTGVHASAAVLKAYQARLAKLEFEEKSGKLHDVEACGKDAFRVARATRDALLGIPDRLSAELAGETDQFMIRKRLEDEIRLALENLAVGVESQG